MKNTKMLLLASFIFPVISQAQSHRIEAGLGGYKMINVVTQQKDLINNAHIRYTWLYNSKIGFYAQYTHLPLKGWLLAEVEPGLAKESAGKLVEHMQYNYFDLGVQYRLLKRKQHSIAATGAVSLAYGKDNYLSRVVWTDPEPGEPYGHPIHAEYKEKRNGYIGANVGLKYDYHFWKNRINLGTSFSTKYYINHFPFQVDYAIHAGYNF